MNDLKEQKDTAASSQRGDQQQFSTAKAPSLAPIDPRMNTNATHQPLQMAPASPNSYGSVRSSNRPSSAGDQSLSLPSMASSDPAHISHQHQHQNNNPQIKLRNSGVAQGVELLERQQLERERKRAEERRVQMSAVQSSCNERRMGGSGRGSPRKSLSDAALGNTMTDPRAKQRSNRSMIQTERGGAAAASRGGPPQDNHSVNLSICGVPKTVHLSGDGDDVSESLIDETIVTAQVGASAQVEKKEMKRVNSFTKFLMTPLKSTQNFKRNISDRFNSDPTGVQENNSVSSPNSNSTCTMKPILSGYLRKHGRNGKWQRRYFETDGTSLMYYKNKQRTSILATLDLLHVGKIQLDSTDPAGCTFMIEVKGRNYYLCADSKERARDWVISLNRVKEARLQIGGLKLIEPQFENSNSGGENNRAVRADNQNIDEVDGEDDNVAARIVMVAARKRLKGLGKDDFSEMERSLDEQNNSSDVGLTRTSMSPRSGSAATGSLVSSNPNSPHAAMKAAQHPSINFLATGQAIQNSVRVRWTKRRNAIQNWTRRLSRWAKRLTMIRCIVKDDVVHYNPELQQRLQEESQGSNHTDGGPIPKSPHHHQGGELFIDLGAPSYSSSYPELYSESQLTGRQINFSADVTNISSKESLENSAYHSTKSSTTSRAAKRKPSLSSRMLEPSVKEEVSRSSQSSGRATPNEADDESGVV